MPRVQCLVLLHAGLCSFNSMHTDTKDVASFSALQLMQIRFGAWDPSRLLVQVSAGERLAAPTPQGVLMNAQNKRGAPDHRGSRSSFRLVCPDFIMVKPARRTRGVKFSVQPPPGHSQSNSTVHSPKRVRLTPDTRPQEAFTARSLGSSNEGANPGFVS